MPETYRARVSGDEPLVKRIAALVAESIDDAVTAAIEGIDGAWSAELHFAAPPDQETLRELVGSAGGDSRHLTVESVAEQDWVAASLSGLRAVEAGRFVVHGAHDRARVPPNRIGIEIEAALAFGTGHHGTTRGCLLAIDALARRRTPRRVLDIGTGTGVLAIAAARAFHRPVVATDIDRVAVVAARDNARRNRAGAYMSPRLATGARGITGRYDLILANILLGPLTRLAAPLARLTARHGTVVLSGLLREHGNAALAAYRAQGLALERRIPLDEWTTLVLRRGPAKANRPGKRPRRRLIR